MNETDRKRLRGNTVLLTRDLCVDKMFLAVLQQRGTLSDTMIEDIECLPKRTDRNGEFLSILPRRGPNAFNDFIIALMETRQDHLAEALSPEIAAQWRKVNPYGPTATTRQNNESGYGYSPSVDRYRGYATPTAHPGGFVLPSAGDAERDSFIPIKLQPSNPVFTQQVLRNPKDYYKMSANPRGRVIILNNEQFDQSEKAETKLTERDGSYFDVVNLDELFKALGFETKFWSNFTSAEIRKKINEERKSTFHSNADAFIFIILSHGTRGAIYGTDGVKVKIEEEIIDQFDGNHCPQLAGKPKLFFIQACQGDQITVGSIKADSGDQDDAVLDEKLKELEDQKDAVPTSGSFIHEKADVLVFYSTVPGYKSWRNTELGSWFMRDLVININQYAHLLHIGDILTKVNNQLSERQVKYKGFKQISKYESTFRKMFYFLPKSH